MAKEWQGIPYRLPEQESVAADVSWWEGIPLETKLIGGGVLIVIVAFLSLMRVYRWGHKDGEELGRARGWSDGFNERDDIIRKSREGS